MLIRKITVKTRPSNPDGLDETFISQITQEYSLIVTPFTKIKKLLSEAKRVCKSNDDDETLQNRFLIDISKQFQQLDSDANLLRLLAFIGYPQTINLIYMIGIPGGLGIDDKNGIYYFYHTNEKGHVPHIHARYQGEEISIEILTLNVRGQLKNKKKQKEIIEYVKCNKKKLLKDYNLKTNGIHIDSKYVENGITINLPR